ncbi:hypothetical protein PHMEG_00027925 [Phytophthora megakarya]|uniref:Uncharacterized protein n=1 Tax=Phytophthora megakarya TaxID=4795 RepID=A0A225V4H4_9STRA|nr:hypothetical protein PHMEG_00027925 [Phytophthora megakarya]
MEAHVKLQEASPADFIYNFLVPPVILSRLNTAFSSWRKQQQMPHDLEPGDGDPIPIARMASGLPGFSEYVLRFVFLQRLPLCANMQVFLFRRYIGLVAQIYEP